MRLFIAALACLISVALKAQNNYSLNFDGENDFVDLSNVTSLLLTSGSISIDFKIPSNQTYDIDESQFINPSYGLFAIDNGQGDPLVVRIGAGCYSESSTISLEDDDCGQSNPNVRAFFGNDSYQLFDNQWHNITLVSNESGHELYLDGLALTLTYTLGDSSINLWPNDYSVCRIGSGLFDASSYLGNIDNVIIWGFRLTENQIQEYITCKPTGDEDGLIGYWDFNEGQGDIVVDLSPHSTQGVVNGALWSTDTPEQNCNYNNTLGPCNNQTSITYQGYEYDIVEIGDQCWFAENCRYLPEVSTASQESETEPYYYVYDYDGTDVEDAKATNSYQIYGALYNWPAVMTEGICPSGWHIPSDEEWQTMEMSLGMSESEATSVGWRGIDEGYKMKSTSGWNNNGNGDNSSGFNALPGGSIINGGFNYYGNYGDWWTSSESGVGSWLRTLKHSEFNVRRGDDYRKNGFSARCVTEQLIVLISGCTDDQACNFNENAVEDDGSCEYITPVDLGENIETCDESVILDAGAGYDSYTWSTGETTQTIEVTESGEYGVEVTSFSNNMDEIQGYNLIGTFESNKYFISENSILWEEAREISENIGGHLVTITSSEENDFIWTAVYNNGLNPGGSNNYQAWIGLFQNVDSPNYNEPDGGWEWVTGEEITYENWADGLPNNFADGYYAHITDGGNTDCYSGNILCGVWDDAGYTNNLTTAFYVVEFENLSICSDISNITVNFNSSGCTDETACNYDSEATCDDGSCEYITPVDLGEDIETCEESITLDAGAGYDSYLWSTGETTQTIEVNESGDYSVEVGNLQNEEENSFSMNFDGINDYVNFGDLLNTPSQNGTILLSFNPHEEFNANNQNRKSIIDKYNNLNDAPIDLRLDEYNGELIWRLQSEGNNDINSWQYVYSNTTQWNANQWYDIAVTWGSEGMNMYVNGILESTNETTITPRQGYFDLLLGAGHSWSGQANIDNLDKYFNGLIDDFQIWDIVLGPDEIIQYGNCNPSIDTEGLIAFYDFNSGSDTFFVYDQTENGFNGVIPNNGSGYNEEFDQEQCQISTCLASDSISITFNTSGCTDEAACNYDAEATCDDGSCEYITPVDLGDDIETCEESVTLDAGAGYNSYLWSTGETTQTIEITESGEYSVEVINGTVDDFSLKFDGISDFVLVQNNNSSMFELNNTISLSAWVKVYETQNSQIAGSMDFNCSDGDGYRLNLRNNGDVWAGLGCYPSADYGLGENAYNENEWIYLTGIFKDNDFIKLYINGIFQDSISHTRTFNNHSSDFYIGAGLPDQLSPNYEHLEGIIAEVSRWNIELTQEEILQFMSCSPTGEEYGLVGYWKFNEGEGDTVIDLSGNGNNGIINGATWSNDTPEQSCVLCQSTDEISITFNTSGCIDETACNYDFEATCDDGSCLYFEEDECDCDGNTLDALGICGGVCWGDFNSNGICDNEDIFGCTYEDANNYNAEATADDGSCIYNEVCVGDLFEDGYITIQDLMILLAVYGTTCE